MRRCTWIFAAPGFEHFLLFRMRGFSSHRQGLEKCSKDTAHLPTPSSSLVCFGCSDHGVLPYFKVINILFSAFPFSAVVVICLRSGSCHKSAQDTIRACWLYQGEWWLVHIQTQLSGFACCALMLRRGKHLGKHVRQGLSLTVNPLVTQ